MIKAQKRKEKRLFPVVLLAICLLAILIFSLFLGRYKITVTDLFHILISRILPMEQTWTDMAQNMVWLVRMPRIVIAIMVGAALAAAGSAYQCIFQNPMASPDILGASTGAGFGAALAIIMNLSSIQITASAFIGGIICVGLVIFCARMCRGNQVMNLILAGIMIGSLFQAGTSYLKLIADPHNTLPEITYWLMGSLSGASAFDLCYIWIPMLMGSIPLFLLRWKMNLLTMGEEEARTMGVNTRRIRIAVIISATFLTAASVSVSGMIGWIGLVIPHMARRMVGNDCRVLIPASALLGGSFLLLVDDLARNLYSTELPLGILTAVIGAPFFIYLLARGGRQSGN